MEVLIVYPTKAQEKKVIDFLESLNVPFKKKQEVLPSHVIEGIKKGQGDIESGDTISFDDFKQKMSIYK